MAPVTAVLFDWNGTIVDDRSRAIEASNEIRSAHGLTPLAAVEWEATWCLPLTEHAERLGIAPEHADAAVELWNRAVAIRSAPLSAGAAELLEALASADVAAGVITAASADALAGDLATHALQSSFEWIHTSVVDKARVITEHAADGAVIYVGDSELDMAHGKRGGAITVGFTGGYCTAEQLRHAGADHLVDDLRLVASLRTNA